MLVNGTDSDILSPETRSSSQRSHWYKYCSDKHHANIMSSRALSLYRSILRAHSKYLPTEMRELGDAYVKSEFRLHKSATKPEQLHQFFVAWEEYLDELLTTARAKEVLATGSLDNSAVRDDNETPFSFGRDLPQDTELSDEQKQQLEKLREETKKAGKS